jgi:UDPglucose--hexose-1-phosphate uridylyltransferase
VDQRLDELTRVSTVIVGARQGRPNLPADDCPFCPGGLEAPEPYEVRWFVNRWAPMPDDRCELVLYTPEHAARFATLGAAGARKVIDLWAERSAALGARDDVGYVLVFENNGPEVGATIAHPHGQIYAFDSVPPVPLRELVDGVMDAASVPEELVVARTGTWVTWVPPASVWPYELRIASTSEVGALTDPAWDRDGLAAALVDASARLDQLFDVPMPYMMWIHQRPFDGQDWPGARLHVHFSPINRRAGVPRFVAAAELGGGIYFNPVVPEEAAASLRQLPGGLP